MSMIQSGAAAAVPMAPTKWAEKLSRSGAAGFRHMAQFCRQRKRFIREYVGSHYGGLVPAEGKERRPFNVLNQGVQVVVPNMVCRNPRTTVKARRPVLKGTATLMEMLSRHANEKDRFAAILRRGTVDAMFTAGIFYTNIVDSGMVMQNPDGTVSDIGRVATECLSLDHLTIDAAANHWEQKTFIGHQMRIRRDDAMERGLYAPEFIEQCPSYAEEMHKQGRVEDMLRGGVNREEANAVADYIYVTQFWLPRENIIVTLPGLRDEQDFPTGGEYFDERPYYGPEDEGPYDMMGFAYAPDMLMPVAPVGIWLDMHLALNVVARKLVDQIKAMKSLVVGDMAAEDDLTALDQAEHTGIVRARNVDRIKALNWAAPADSSLQIFQFLMNASNTMQGNTEMLGGLRSTGRTATESELIAAGGNVRITDMREIVYDCATAIQKKRAWYHFHDPLLQEVLTREIAPGIAIQIPVSPDMIEGDFIDYNFAIDVHSMERTDPRLAAKQKMDHMQVIAAAVQLEQATGFRFNADAEIRITGREVYDPGELEDIWRTPEAAMQMAEVFGMYQPAGGGPAQGMGGGPSSPAQPGAGPVTFGRPGRPGMAGRGQTGASSPNFDRQANTQASMGS